MFSYGISEVKYEQYVDDVKYTAQPEFPNGALPLEKDVLLCMLYLLRPDRSDPSRTLNEAAQIVAANLADHWTLFNIYTIPVCNDYHLKSPKSSIFLYSFPHTAVLILIKYVHI